MKILSIETSCDETAFAVVNCKGGLTNPSFKVEKNFVSSQIKIHRPFGGVVPNLAKREHLKNLPLIFNKLEKFYPNLKNIDAIAVTVGPGLEPALWTGINFAKDIGEEYGLPVLGGNHLEGHLYSSLLSHKDKVKLPAIALIVSGGHTMILKMDKLSSWKKIGETRDDAVGEAFDKVARLLKLPYPGGPEVEKLAAKGNENAIEFPRPMLTHKNYDFSFSGLKTSVLYYLRDNPPPAGGLKKADVAASFQKAAVDVLVKKTLRASDEFGAETIILGGGVAANKYLKTRFSREAKRAGIKFLVPKGEFNTDNAAMIAASSYINNLKKKKYKLIAQANLSM